MDGRRARDLSQSGLDRSTRLMMLAQAQWDQIRQARYLVEASHACLAATRRQLQAASGDQGVARALARPPVRGEPRMQSEPEPGALPSWSGLSDGSPEQEAAVAEAVREIVELQYLLIEGISRHFPALATDIREVAQHLLENAPNLVDPACCERTRAAARSERPMRQN